MATTVTGGMETKRSEVGELRTLLRSPEVQKDPKRYLQAVQKVIACMTLGIDVSKLFSDMIMASATQDVVRKKLVYLYLSNYAESHSDLALLTVNTLQKDCQDRNPMVRGLALRSMCSLRVPNILEYQRGPLMAGLSDRSAYVRRTAVMGIVKIFYFAPELITELNLVDILYQMLRDKDPQVVCNCTSALNEILASEGGMVMNTKIAHYLLNRIREFSEWAQCHVFELLLRYQPSTEEEVFDVLNILDDRLKHSNFGVVLGAVRLFLHFTEEMPALQPDVHQRIRTPLLTFLGSTSSELVYMCLQHIQLLVARQEDLFSNDYQAFFCRYNDSAYVKMKKLEVLTELCSVNNAQEIVDELGECVTDVNVLVARKAIQAIGRIALRLPARANTCVEKLLSLLTMEIDYVTSETLVATTNVLRRFDNLVEVILPQLPTSFDSVSDAEGRAALIWILGEYGESLSNTPYVLEELVGNVAEESSSLVKLQLLSAVAKTFFKRPPETQETLGRLLEHTIDEEGDMDVRDRGMLYYRLLKYDVREAQRVVCGQTKVVAEENTVIPRLSLFPEFNTLSVMYGQSSENFITQEAPYVLGAPSAHAGAETNFEVVSEVSPVSQPSVSTSQPSSQSSPLGPLRAVGRSSAIIKTDIHVDISAPLPNTPPVILLHPTTSMTAGDFEQKWIAMAKNHEMELRLDYVPPPKELERVLASRFIMTMASSPPDKPTIKFFFHAQNVSTLHLFLMEVDLEVTTALMSLTLKCENPNQAQAFLTHFLQTLVMNRWLSASS